MEFKKNATTSTRRISSVQHTHTPHIPHPASHPTVDAGCAHAPSSAGHLLRAGGRLTSLCDRVSNGLPNVELNLFCELRSVPRRSWCLDLRRTGLARGFALPAVPTMSPPIYPAPPPRLESFTHDLNRRYPTGQELGCDGDMSRLCSGESECPSFPAAHATRADNHDCSSLATCADT